MSKKHGSKQSNATKKIVSVILIVVLLAVLIVGVIMAAEYFDISFTKSKGLNSGSINIIVPEGSTGSDIGQLLKDNGLIKSKLVFSLRLKNSEYAGKLRSGSFVLAKGMTISEILEELATGGEQRSTMEITIPEGYSVEQIAARLESAGLFTAEEFLDEVNNGEFDYEILSSIPTDGSIKYRLQGFLFPSTYNVYTDSTPHEIIDKMLRQFIVEYDAISGESSRSPFEIVTIASLVEREAKLDDERPTIAGVIENRLSDGMKLQIDAAVQYVVSDGMYNVTRILYKDLEVESPYNVYLNYGLPAGPICNPGAKSIQAAMAPESHSYLFYHTDEAKGDGSHIFTETFADHQATMN